MPDFLNTGISGLIAFQRSLATTSHNISNASTEGYSRQRIELATRPPQGSGSGFIGSGVNVSTVERVYDEFLVGQVRTQTTRNSELSAYYDLASRIDNLLSDPDAGVSPMLQEFFNATQSVADAPSSTPARQVMLTTAESLVERLHYMYDGMNSLNRAITQDVENTVTEINQLAISIGEMNSKIVLESQRFGQPPNDLLDQRDELLRQLSERISVSVVKQDDGAANVFIGTGQNLVVGNRVSTLRVVPNSYDASQFEIELGTGTGTGINISNSINGGRLGGIFTFKQQILDPALNQLGRVTVGLAATFNQQHSQGLTLNDVLGGNFFNDFLAAGGIDVSPSNKNTGSGVVAAEIVDVSKLTASDYILRYDGANNYSLLRMPDRSVATTFSGAVPVTTQFEGVQIRVTTAPAAGDSFLIRPTRTAAQNISLNVSDPTNIAVAGAVRAYGSSSNLGNATITPGTLITDTADAAYVAPAVFNSVTPVTIQFQTSGAGTAPYADEYSLDGGTTWLAYTSGADIKLNGMQVKISGTPFNGDQFTMERNVGAVSDNRNALELAALQSKSTLGDKGTGATVDFQGAYGQLVSMVGTRTHQANVAGKAQSTILQQAIDARDTVSGVNLDEEAANLLKMQQAYQAAAKVITTAQTLFQSLLDAVR